MKYLLDTCVYLWAITDKHKKIPKPIIEIITDNHNEIYVSIISQIETTIKHNKHQISGLKSPIIDYYKYYRIKSGISFLNLAAEDIEILSKLPDIHNDPFDRLLIAQAINNGMTLISPDKNFIKYPVKTIY